MGIVWLPNSLCDIYLDIFTILYFFLGVETGSGKFCPMMPPKVDAELLMSGPVFPIPDHYSKYTPQPFGCSGSGLKLDLPKELNGPGNRDVGDRHSALIDSGKYVPEVKPKVEGPLQMSGPKLPNIEAKNQFNIVTPRVPTAAARMEMPGPVYPDVVSSNHYSHVEEKVPGKLVFIIYQITYSTHIWVKKRSGWSWPSLNYGEQY